MTTYSYVFLSSILVLSYVLIELLNQTVIPLGIDTSKQNLQIEYDSTIICSNLFVGFCVDKFGPGRTLFFNFLVTPIILYQFASSTEISDFQTFSALLTITNMVVLPAIFKIGTTSAGLKNVLYMLAIVFAARQVLVSFIVSTALSFFTVPQFCWLCILCSIFTIFGLYKLVCNHWDNFFRPMGYFDLAHFILPTRLNITSASFWITLFAGVSTSCVMASRPFYDKLVETNNGSEYFDAGVFGGVLLMGYFYLYATKNQTRYYILYSSITLCVLSSLAMLCFPSLMNPVLFLLSLGFGISVPHCLTIPLFITESCAGGRMMHFYCIILSATYVAGCFFRELTKNPNVEDNQILKFILLLVFNLYGASYLGLDFVSQQETACELGKRKVA